MDMHFNTNDIDAFMEWSHSVGVDEQRSQISKGRGSFQVSAVTLGDLVVFRQQSSQTHLAEYAPQAGYVEVCLGVGIGGMRWCGLDTPDTAVTIHRGGQSYSSYINENALVYGIGMPDDLARSYGVEAASAITPADLYRFTSPKRDIRPLLRRIDHLLHAPSSSQNGSPLHWIEQEELLAALFEVSTGNGKVPEIERKAWKLEAHRITCDARDLIESRLRDPVFIPEIAEVLGISRRFLEYAFRNVLGMSPYQYALNKKLHEGRRLLKESDQSVYDIATDLAFTHPGRFAKKYQTLFGELPSQTRSAHI